MRLRLSAVCRPPLVARYSSSSGPSLRDFMPTKSADAIVAEELPPYLSPDSVRGDGRTVFVETYGCQMNVSDTEVVHALLQEAGYTRSPSMDAADVVLLNTCAIREKAETTVWNRLREIRGLQRKGRQRGNATTKTVGVLGCMGERLKGKLLEKERLVDVVCGPDAYRSLPRLLTEARAGQPSLDVALSLEETYADVAPVRAGGDGVSAFVSIARGCNNMCSYCIVPFTRGRERSRPADSIAREVAALAAEGYREVTLLGQNVNSYADASALHQAGGDDDVASAGVPAVLVPGFQTKVPPPRAAVRFGGLLERLAIAHPEMRFRFTSPHPKDFPDDVLHVIARYPNVCESLHIPAQSGSSAVLDAMRRGYDRPSYDALIKQVGKSLRLSQPRLSRTSGAASRQLALPAVGLTCCRSCQLSVSYLPCALSAVGVTYSRSRRYASCCHGQRSRLTSSPGSAARRRRIIRRRSRFSGRCAMTRPSCLPTLCGRRPMRTGG